MKTSIKKLTNLNRALTVELPVNVFKQKVEQILQKIASQAKIDGFRKGKVPVAIMRKNFGEQANQDAINEMVNDTLGDAIAKEKITPAGRPKITKADAASTEFFTYTVEFEVYPEIKVGDFSKLKIEQIEAKITAEDEEKGLKELANKTLEYQKVKRKSKSDDQITIDFKGTIDGKEFEGGKAVDFQLVLGTGSMIPGFEDGLMGIATGDSTRLNLTFPKTYHVTDLAGKDVVFAVEIKQVSAPKMPELNDEFAKKFDKKNMDDLRQDIKQQMRIELDNRLTAKNKDALFDALLDANDFIVPQASIDAEANNLLEEMTQRMQQQGMPMKGNMPASTFNSEAQRRVKLGLLVNQISIDNKLSASKAELDAKLLELSMQYGENAKQMIDYYNQDPARMSGIELLVVEQKVQDGVLAKAKVTIKNKTFKDLTQRI